MARVRVNDIDLNSVNLKDNAGLEDLKPLQAKALLSIIGGFTPGALTYRGQRGNLF